MTDRGTKIRASKRTCSRGKDYLLMDSEALGQYVADQTAGILLRTEALRPYYEELWRRFKALKKGETICGCTTRTEYAKKILHRSMRSIQYALYGRRPLQSCVKNVVQGLMEGFVPSQFVQEESRARAQALKEADAKWEREHPEEVKEARQRWEESKRRREAYAQNPDDGFLGDLFGVFGRTPPLKDISEFASLGRQAAAKRYHPDRGGNAERMAALNHVADWLEGLASMAA